MSLQTDAARELHRFLTQLGTPYAIIGGLAVQFWGEPRFTQDVDVTVMTPRTAPNHSFSTCSRDSPRAFQTRRPLRGEIA